VLEPAKTIGDRFENTERAVRKSERDSTVEILEVCARFDLRNLECAPDDGKRSSTLDAALPLLLKPEIVRK
jgi:hypothetical protein